MEEQRQLEISLVQRKTWLEIRKPELGFVPRCQWTWGNLPAHST